MSVLYTKYYDSLTKSIIFETLSFEMTSVIAKPQTGGGIVRFLIALPSTGTYDAALTLFGEYYTKVTL